MPGLERRGQDFLRHAVHHPLPEIILVVEHQPGSGGRNQPAAGFEFSFQLTCSPAGVAGKEAEGDMLRGDDLFQLDRKSVV